MLVRLLALLVIAPALVLPAAASPESEATAFVNDGVERGLDILAETGANDPDRAAKFRDFVNDVVDQRSVALFVLGPYRRDADPATVDAFVEAFRGYATASYESRLDDYGGQVIEVTDAIAKSEKDVLVQGKIRNQEGKELADVAFRVLKTPRGLQLFDVSVGGIWLAVEQRNQFSSFLGQNNGSIQALIDHLNEQAAKLRSGEIEASAS